MKPRRILTLLICIYTAAGVLCSGFPAFAATPSYARLTVPMFFETEIPADMELINDAVNEITRQKIGAEVKLVPLLSFAEPNADLRRQAELELLRKDGIEFDLLNNVLDVSVDDAIDLSPLLQQYGQGALRVIAEECPFNRISTQKEVYLLPSVSDYVASCGVTMRKDLLDKYAIDAHQIRDIYDLNAVFTQIHQAEPELKIICSYRTGNGFLTRCIAAYTISGTPFALKSEHSGTLVNYYASSEFSDLIHLFRKWYLAGYMPENMALQTINASELVRAGELFAYFSACKPGIEVETSQACGQEMVTIPLMEPIISEASSSSKYWAISKNCKNPGKAMQFLNLLYTDSELVNLLLYGIEGVHYQLTDVGAVAYPNGISSETVGYANSMPWLMPNELISYVRDGYDSDLWEQTRAFNLNAIISPLADFTLDDSEIADSLRQLNDIVNRYLYGLTSGQIDPDLYLPQMLDEMEEAGVDAVLAKVQGQLDEYMATKEKAS